MSPTLNVAICGAGPVGLTLARLLLKSTFASQVQVTIFEKDASSTSRTSIGGTLDLHPLTGLAAIKALDLWDSFLRYARFEGEEMRMCDLNGFVYIHQLEAPPVEGFEERPEIDRVRLLEVLLEGVASISGDVIRWGKGVREVVAAQESGKWSVKFDDDTMEGPFDLVVGADGAWSKVRKELTDVKPSYSGISSVSGNITPESAGDKWESISGMVGKGNNFSFSFGQSEMGQRMGDGSLKVSFDRKCDLAWSEQLKADHTGDDEAIKRVLYECYKDWVPEFQQWITASKDLWCAPLWELPVGHRFGHKQGLTLIGDAAHLMTPFAGEGVNAGMKDALDLFTAIEKILREELELDTAVLEFEESMFTRAVGFMTETMTNKQGMFAADAPYSFFAGMVGVVLKEIGYDTKKGWLSWVPVRSTAYSIFWIMGTFGAGRRRVRDLLRKQT